MQTEDELPTMSRDECKELLIEYGLLPNACDSMNKQRYTYTYVVPTYVRSSVGVAMLVSFEA